jgi:hypothetical protein
MACAAAAVRVGRVPPYDTIDLGAMPLVAQKKKDIDSMGNPIFAIE